MSPCMFRHILSRTVILMILVLLSHGATAAEEVLSIQQPPGYQRMKLGDYTITAIYDGHLEMDMRILKNASETEIRDLLVRGFVNPDKLRIEVTAFVIETGKKTILVDMGAGKLFGPTVGKAFENLQAAGFKAENIDVVLITHMHPDHVGGLIDDKGQARFPKAKVYASKIETDFWLSEEMMAKAPEGGKHFFKMAQACSAPYRKSGAWKTLEPGDRLVAGMVMVPAPGHTPGHTAFEVSSKGETLLIVGDAVHCMAAQLPRPDIVVGFDINSVQAIETRKKLFEDAAKRKVWVAAMHLPFPGLGKVTKDDNGGYGWFPVWFSQPQ